MDKLESIEIVRKKELKVVYILGGIGLGFLAISIILLLLFYFGNFDEGFFYFGILFLISIVLIVLSVAIPSSRYNSYCKKNLEQMVMNDTYKDIKFEYIPENGCSFGEMNNINIFKKPDEFHASDTVRGVYKDVEFVLSDYVFVVITYTYDSKGNRHENRHVYPGRYMFFNLERNFDAGISICDRGANSEVFNMRLFNEQVEFESIDFNKKFVVTSNNKNKAFKLIRPKEIINLLDIKNKYRGHIVNVLKDKSIYFILSDVSTEFKFNLFKKVSDILINDIKAYYKVPFFLIDELDLYKDKFNNKEID